MRKAEGAASEGASCAGLANLRRGVLISVSEFVSWGPLMKFKSIGIITYNCPHLKTEQVVREFTRKGYSIRLFALPFALRKPRKTVFEHRPYQFDATHPKELAMSLDLEYVECQSDLDIGDECDIYHVLVGKIISPECIKGKRILNCHAGIIPAVRGLDAFKWAILDRQPLGVTLHFIDEQIDQGEIVSVIETRIESDDSIQDLAERHYLAEVQAIIDFEKHLQDGKPAKGIYEARDARLRMSPKLEEEMLNGFAAYLESAVD